MNSEFVTQSVPSSMRPVERVALYFRFNNPGDVESTIWDDSVGFKLLSEQSFIQRVFRPRVPTYSLSWSPTSGDLRDTDLEEIDFSNRIIPITAMGADNPDAGDVVDFQFLVEIVDQVGTFESEWSLIRSGNLFGEKSDKVTITIKRFWALDMLPENLRNQSLYPEVASIIDHVVDLHHNSNLGKLKGLLDFKSPYFEREYLAGKLAPSIVENIVLEEDYQRALVYVNSGIYNLKGTDKILEYLFRIFGFEVIVRDADYIRQNTAYLGITGDPGCHIMLEVDASNINLNTDARFRDLARAVEDFIWICVEYEFYLLKKFEEELHTIDLVVATGIGFIEELKVFDYILGFICEDFDPEFRTYQEDPDHPQYFTYEFASLSLDPAETMDGTEYLEEDMDPDTVIYGPSVKYSFWIGDGYADDLNAETDPKCRLLLDVGQIGRSTLLKSETEPVGLPPGWMTSTETLTPGPEEIPAWEEDGEGNLIPQDGDIEDTYFELISETTMQPTE